MRSWWRLAVSTGDFVGEAQSFMWGPAHGGQYRPSGRRSPAQAAHSPMGAKRPVPFTLPVCEPSCGQEPGIVDSSSCHQHLSHSPRRYDRQVRCTKRCGDTDTTLRQCPETYHMLYLNCVYDANGYFWPVAPSTREQLKDEMQGSCSDPRPLRSNA